MKVHLIFFPIPVFSFILFFFTGNQTLSAQTGAQKIEIIRADALKMDTLHKARKLVGNVILRQGDVTMECDSALFYNMVNALDAYGNVHIHDPSTKAYADSLNYNGENKIATLRGRVRVLQDSVTLETNYLTYHMEFKNATYFNGGKIVSPDATITSVRGNYDTQSENAFFSREVKVVGTDYTIETDTLRYNTAQKISYFLAPTFITRPDEKIYCESGWYDSQSGKSVFGKNTVFESGSQRINTDSLHYDSNSGAGKAFLYFSWTDTAQQTQLIGKRADYFKEGQRIIATDSASLIYMIDNDSLFLSADTLKSGQDSLGNTEFFAFPSVRIFRTNLQGVCDSLAFSFSDSTIRMYQQPILWNDGNQLTGDTIIILMHDGKLDKLELFDNGFIVNKAHLELYNQIKGRRITGFFLEKKLDKMLVEGNGESIYYGKDDNGLFIGVNKAECSNMWIYMKNQEVQRIVFLTNPDAVFHPITQVNTKELILKGFSWRESLRPLSKQDIFSKELD